MEFRDGFVRCLTRDYFRRRPDEFDVMEAILTPDSLDEIDALPTFPEYQAYGHRVDEAVRDYAGASLSEIVALCELLEEYEDAVAYDVLQAGERLRYLGSERLTWGDLRLIVQQTPPHESALYRAMNPDTWQWGLSELLLAEIADSEHVANWQRGGGKSKDRPKPIPRPGVEPESTTYGKGAVPYDEMAEFLGGDFLALA